MKTTIDKLARKQILMYERRRSEETGAAKEDL